MAREQAEREAQMRQEDEARKAEQERLRAEEEQRRKEETEQIRLAEEHRRIQEEKLHIAMVSTCGCHFDLVYFRSFFRSLDRSTSFKIQH